MMKPLYYIRHLLTALLIWMAAGTLHAQFDARFSQYWDVQGYYHPAAVGRTERLNLYGAYGMQLMGFTRAPRSMTFGAELPFSLLGMHHGAGLGFFNEGIGLFRNQRFYLQYAFRLKLTGGQAGIGVQAGMASVSFDPTDINLGDEAEDEAFPSTEENGKAFDLGVGLYYQKPRFFLALSGHHLTAPRIQLGEKSHLNIKPMVYFTGGYNIQTRNPLISIQPSCHVQSDFQSTRVDLTGRLLYSFRSKVFSGGVTYSPQTSATFSLGLKIRNLQVGYAYELFTSKIGAASGSHDIAVSYALDLSSFKKKRNLHKSVRIL